VRVDCALICDYATVREGLLHILGGGITRIHRPLYPAPLGISLALRIMVHPTEATREHEVQVLLSDEDGNRVAQLEAKFTAAPVPGMAPGEELSVPIPITAVGWPVPHPGPYRFDILVDGNHQADVSFIALTQAPQALPGMPPPGQPPSGQNP
jgi:hypothetical protein